MTAGEIAAHLHVSVRTVVRRIRDGGMPVRRMGRLIVSHKSWIAAWIEERCGKKSG